MGCHIKLEENILERLRCPVCKGKLEAAGSNFSCVSPQCQKTFPVVDGVPVLISEANSLFTISDFVHRSTTTIPVRSKLENLAKKLTPALDRNLKSKENLRRMTNLLLEENATPQILILGGGVTGRGLENMLSHPSVQFVESDVSWGPRTSLICDAHDIPFDNESFDGVIIQVTLEHVVDPYRCVEEIHRVLKKNGIVYAETPFMERVHVGRYDFTRFTHLGHRRLFRRFDEICSGAGGGPAMALAWAYEGFLLSFARSKLARGIIKVFARFTAWGLKYIDYYLINKPGALDAALEYYFLGRKSNRIVPDREIIKEYRGVIGT
jgi:uncharacterized protein YbaR (Trm112 family)/SAM-dependent methyltransferase